MEMVPQVSGCVHKLKSAHGQVVAVFQKVGQATTVSSHDGTGLSPKETVVFNVRHRWPPRFKDRSLGFCEASYNSNDVTYKITSTFISSSVTWHFRGMRG